MAIDMRPAKKTPLIKPRTAGSWLSFLLFLVVTLQDTNSFQPTVRQRSARRTALFADTLQDRTVKELWQILEESNLLERGLKSQLKRKEDIIRYIEQHAHQNGANGAGQSTDENASSTTTVQELEQEVVQEDDSSSNDIENKSDSHTNPKGANEESELSYTVGPDTTVKAKEEGEETATGMLPNLDPHVVEKIPPFLAEKMIQRNITSLLPIQVRSFQRIHSGDDVILQAPTGSGE